MNKATYEEVLEILSSGGRVHRHLVSGSAIIFPKGGDSCLGVSPDAFAKLRDEKNIRFDHVMRQGHPVFRGKTEIWHPSLRD